MSEARRQFEYMDLDDFEELLLDKPLDEKWELIAGRVVRGMVGARLEHHEIVQNLNVALRNHIRAKNLPCRTFTETFWLKQRFLKLAAFPDIMVHCGRIEPGAVSIEDPLILVEVVSPSSEGRDRGEKASTYMRLAGLQHVCFVDRDRVRIDIFDRDGASWTPRPPIETLDGSLALSALEFSIRYQRSTATCSGPSRSDERACRAPRCGADHEATVSSRALCRLVRSASR
jgi:Uma2 family endonuclease